MDVSSPDDTKSPRTFEEVRCVEICSCNRYSSYSSSIGSSLILEHFPEQFDSQMN
jgi:hypothetical protein